MRRWPSALPAWSSSGGGRSLLPTRLGWIDWRPGASPALLSTSMEVRPPWERSSSGTPVSIAHMSVQSSTQRVEKSVSAVSADACSAARAFASEGR